MVIVGAGKCTSSIKLYIGTDWQRKEEKEAGAKFRELAGWQKIAREEYCST